MKILTAEEVKLWDKFTIQKEPISSIDLMERAAFKCVEWILKQYPTASSFGIYCGKGNNGGDGLAIARMLLAKKYPVTIHILEFGHLGTAEFQTNLSRLHHISTPDIHFIQSEIHLHPVPSGQIIIDAILGSGVSRETGGITKNLINHINKSECEIISIDIPSGLFVDKSSNRTTTIKANHTLCFQTFKKALLLQENSELIGEVHILNIGLHNEYYQLIESKQNLIDQEMIKTIYKPRNKFTHKGNFGHALLVAGSYGKIGATVMSAKACLRSGVGLLTCHIPKCGYDILQSSIPEAMVMTDINSIFITKIEDDLIKYNTIGIGPGIGTAIETRIMLKEIFTIYKKPIVLDADALNCIAGEKDLLQLIPKGSILTPHPKEFERLFGITENDFDRIDLALQKAKELNCVIVLKGHHTFIAIPDGNGYFNSTGNAGMATAGSGDVLTGIITGFVAQGYSSKDAALFGVYIHGLAADIAISKSSMEALLAGDIIKKLGAAFHIFTS